MTNKSTFNYFTAIFSVMWKGNKHTVLDLRENFESKNDAEIWLNGRKNDAESLQLYNSNKYVIAEEIILNTIEYVSTKPIEY